MAEALVVDTDILIDCLRGRRESIRFLEEQPTRPFVSAASVAELYQAVFVQSSPGNIARFRRLDQGIGAGPQGPLLAGPDIALELLTEIEIFRRVLRPQLGR